MAKYIKFSEGVEYHGIPFDEKDRVEIICHEEMGLGNFTDEEIKNSDAVSVYEIASGGMGGGSDAPMLLTILSPYIAVTFFVSTIIAKGFFDEIGKSLAKLLISKFKSLPSLSKLTIIDRDRNRIELLVPGNMTAEDCEILSESLNNLTKSLPKSVNMIYLTYDVATKKIVVISK